MTEGEFVLHTARQALLAPEPAPAAPADPIRRLLHDAAVYRAGGWNALADDALAHASDLAMAMHGTWAVH